MTVPRKRLPWSLRPRSRRAGSAARNRRRPTVEALETLVLLSNVFQVDYTYDDGSGTQPNTLSWAIDNVNNDGTDTSGAPDQITFDVNGGGTQTITPSAPEPELTRPAIIDGTTQPGYTNTYTPIVQLSGSNISTPNITGLWLGAGSDGSTVEGLVVSQFTGDGIYVQSNDDQILDNYVGTDIPGHDAEGNGENGIAVVSTGDGVYSNLASGNGWNGIAVYGSGVTSGDVDSNITGLDANGIYALGNGESGLSVGQGASGLDIFANVSAANTWDGLTIDGGSDMDAFDNYLGTDVYNDPGLGNGDSGVSIFGGSTDNTIGGTNSDTPNFISDNGTGGNYGGVDISGSGTTGNVVESNSITNNVNDGVDVFGGATGNTIGGVPTVIFPTEEAISPDVVVRPTTMVANTITLNGGAGVVISGSGTSDNTVEGNYIGTDAKGDTGLGNTYQGVFINESATDNTVGGTDAGAGNTIAGNGTAANSSYFYSNMEVDGDGTSGNIVEGNYIGTNSAFAEDLNAPYDSGVFVGYGASGNTIGASDTTVGNTIEYNTEDGVDLASTDGFGDATSGNVVAGNVIADNANSGVVIYGGASDNTVGGTGASDVDYANQILGNGTNGDFAPAVNITDAGTSGNVVAGNAISLNQYDGVDIQNGATDNTIGGTDAGAANTIDNNDWGGVTISGAGTSDNVVEGNYIGTDSAGNTGEGNGLVGVTIDGGATDNTIGGLPVFLADAMIRPEIFAFTPSPNWIDSNGAGGVNIEDSGTTGNLVATNYIGTDPSDAANLGNSGDGVVILNGADGNTIGGYAPDARNVISGNTDRGIYIADAGPSGNLVASNYIGTNVEGDAPLPNAAEGVLIVTDDAAGEPSSSNTIADNTIAGNGPNNPSSGSGISINNAASTLIEYNYIGTNADGDTGLGNGEDGIHLLPATINDFVGTGVADTTIIGNTIAENANNGIQIDGSGSTGNVIQGNFIGTNSSSQAALGNVNDGILIDAGANGNTVGGTDPGDGNTIGGNGDNGVDITDSGTSNNLVEGNFIGTDDSGSPGLGNAFQGVAIHNGATGNTIGGTAAQAANVITGNGSESSSTYSYANLALYDAGTSGNLVQGNFIGTNSSNVTGLNALYTFGAFIGNGATGNTIGGTANGAGNTIADNTAAGLVISDSGTTGNIAQGNFIGTNSEGATDLGNGFAPGPYPGAGVLVMLGASGNTVGGTASGAGNAIADNTGNGVIVGLDATDTSVDDSILGNSIYANTALGIDLADDGVTLNDSSGHAGPNLFQDFPVLSSAVYSPPSGTTVIVGTVSGPASTTVRVELFANQAADPSGYGEGQTFLGYVTVPIGAGGTGSFSFTTSASLTGEFISATATDASGNTSEFAKDVAVTTGSDNVTSEVTIKQSGFSVNRSTHQYTQTVTITNTSGSTINGPIYLELANLTNGVTLATPHSTTSGANPPAGSPAVEVSSGSLAPNQSVSVLLTFNNPSNLVINYTPEVLSNPMPL